MIALLTCHLGIRERWTGNPRSDGFVPRANLSAKARIAANSGILIMCSLNALYRRFVEHRRAPRGGTRRLRPQTPRLRQRRRCPRHPVDRAARCSYKDGMGAGVTRGMT